MNYVDFFWSTFVILMGALAVIYSFYIHLQQKRLKSNGLIGEAKMIHFCVEKMFISSTPIKLPVFTFLHKDENGVKTYTVKGKGNSSCEIGEITPIYYNPENPEKEFYLPKKDFLMKYVICLIGMFFFSFGIIFMMRSLNYPTENYFLYLVFSIFSGTLLLFIIGKINYLTNRK